MKLHKKQRLAEWKTYGTNGKVDLIYIHRLTPKFKKMLPSDSKMENYLNSEIIERRYRKWLNTK